MAQVDFLNQNHSTPATFRIQFASWTATCWKTPGKDVGSCTPYADQAWLEKGENRSALAHPAYRQNGTLHPNAPGGQRVTTRPFPAPPRATRCIQLFPLLLQFQNSFPILNQ